MANDIGQEKYTGITRQWFEKAYPNETIEWVGAEENEGKIDAEVYVGNNHYYYAFLERIAGEWVEVGGKPLKTINDIDKHISPITCSECRKLAYVIDDSLVCLDCWIVNNICSDCKSTDDDDYLSGGGTFVINKLSHLLGQRVPSYEVICREECVVCYMGNN